MNLDNAVLGFAGLVTLVGSLLAYFVNSWWLLLVVFAGLNMVQASFTGFCPAAILFRKLGLRPGAIFH